MDPIKEAFSKVKEDMDSLRTELAFTKKELEELKRTLNQDPTHQANQPTFQHVIPTVEQPLEASKSPFLPISTGNGGVPTDKPTNQQTNQRSGNEGVPNRLNRLEKVSELLASLDELKKEVRIKFKRLTNQEMAIFTKIYELDTQGYNVEYSVLAELLSLSEISVRDYVHKITKKGIPVLKEKHGRNRILLSIDPDLKRIASLETIQTLREL